MSADEKKLILEAWERHVQKNTASHKHSCFSATAEEDFRENFKQCVNTAKLTPKEKKSILNAIGL